MINRSVELTFVYLCLKSKTFCLTFNRGSSDKKQNETRKQIRILYNNIEQYHSRRITETKHLHCMVLHCALGNISPYYICLLKTIWVFLHGHFMSRAATRGTVWCKSRFNYEVGVFGRKVCVPNSVCMLA